MLTNADIALAVAGEFATVCALLLLLIFLNRTAKRR